jgi:hypothetical protein
MIFPAGEALDVKPVSLIGKMLQRQILSWDCPLKSRKSKQFNFVNKALENIIRAYYTLELRPFCCFYWTLGD